MSATREALNTQARRGVQEGGENPFGHLPRRYFGCIYADPPWAFRLYSGEDCLPTQADDPYPTMCVEEMASLPVEEIAADNCLLIMWVISSHIPAALGLGASWGFTYRSLGPVWFKEKHPGQSELFDESPIGALGMGYWFRQQTEIALVFGRGSPRRLNADVRQSFAAPRQEHSRKPDEFRRRIERLVSGPYLELFARSQHPGWHAWGNDIDRFQGVR